MVVSVTLKRFQTYFLPLKYIYKNYIILWRLFFHHIQVKFMQSFCLHLSFHTIPIAGTEACPDGAGVERRNSICAGLSSNGQRAGPQKKLPILKVLVYNTLVFVCSTAIEHDSEVQGLFFRKPDGELKAYLVDAGGRRGVIVWHHWPDI